MSSLEEEEQTRQPDIDSRYKTYNGTRVTHVSSSTLLLLPSIATSFREDLPSFDGITKEALFI
jgi:hypothetical protein